MELKYRGLAYYPSEVRMDAIALEEPMTFLGVRSSHKHCQVTQSFTQSERLSYRGIRYLR